MSRTRREIRNAFFGSVLLWSVWANHAAAQAIRVHMHGADEGYAADGFLYAPEAADAKIAAALLLIPDERGVTERVTEAAAGYLAAGYLVVVVDLNRGLPAAAATHTPAEVDHDLAAALDFTTTRANVARSAVGLVAWGSGGAAALRLAERAQLRAVAIDDTAPRAAHPGAKAPSTDVIATFAGHGADVRARELEFFKKRLSATPPP